MSSGSIRQPSGPAVACHTSSKPSSGVGLTSRFATSPSPTTGTVRWRAALRARAVAKFVSSQPQYSALWRKPEAEVMPVCEANGISQIAWSPLAQGVLTGKYMPGAKVPADSRAANKTMNRFIKQWLNDETLTAVQALRPIADGAGVKLSQLALAWVLHQRNVTSVIVGATRPEQVHENAAAADVRLSDDVLAAIDSALKRAVVS